MERTNRQKEILDAAIRIIREHGFSAVTVRRVADEVGVSEPALYRHFPNKLAILECLLDDFQEAVLERFHALEKNVSANPLGDFIDELFDTLGTRESLASLLYSEEAFHAEPALKSRVFAMLTHNSNMLTRAITAQQKRSAVRNDIGAESVSLIVMGCIRVTITKCGLSDGKIRLVDEKKRVMNALNAVLKR